MKEYEMTVITCDMCGNEELERWNGSELFEAETELDALKDAVASLKREHEEGLIGNPFGTKATTMIAEELMKGAVIWNVNDTKFIDIVKMVERSE